MPRLSKRKTGIRLRTEEARRTSLLSARIANINIRMADGTPQPEFNTTYHEVKGFTELSVDFLRFTCQVPDRARCKHCDCIPKRIYNLMCPRHGLCSDCRRDCEGYYCDECRLHTIPEQLGALRSDYNLDGTLLVVQCDVCDKEVLLGQLEDHLWEHTNQGDMECSKVQETTNQKNAHLEICEDASIECAFKEFGCSEKFPRKEMQEHEKDPHNALLNQVILKAMDTISELQQKIKDMERCNMSQQEEAKNKEAKLVKKIQELENRQMSKQEEARNENAKLVKRIQELENCQLEADQYRINLEDDVKVYRSVLQNLEDKVGRISKEAVTRRRVEMLNERVETCLGPLERLLNGLRDVDKE
ncbi:TNF receptor-associated factor 5-like isoform X2 [Ixodes scapularis]|uniref:TNF receptor-associated factor 5-like isoform X2 n=1 Tax=Ixodes scapularis TaxID=6945 RepID=UPI001A9D9D25|nr:TNF receptor-associated factor 5-like isoform X2 [Ixodes scapularis]